MVLIYKCGKIHLFLIRICMLVLYEIFQQNFAGIVQLYNIIFLQIHLYMYEKSTFFL